MKLVAFTGAGRDQVGAVVDTHLADLNAAYVASPVAAGEVKPAGAAIPILPAEMPGVICGNADGRACN